MKHIKKSKQNNDETREAGILISAHDWSSLLRQINFEDLIKEFATKKCRRKLFKVDFVFMNTVFRVFRLLTDFVCLYTYEFWLSLRKIVRSSVILLLPLLAILAPVERYNI
jgi:hypothetical protein